MNACAPRASLRRNLPAALLLALCAAWLVPALAADPLSLKDILSKAQTEAETKAVSDLIDKLKGVARPKASSPSVPSPAPPTEGVRDAGASAQPVPTPDAPGPAQPDPARERPAAPLPAQGQPVVSAPEAAVEAAAGKRLPSVDLEVFFSYNSDEIGAEALSVLRTLGQALRDASLADDAFLIAGHTDAKGGARFNVELSRRRAEAVRGFLIANFGIDAKRLVARGFGFTHPKNSAEPLSAENRRVQIVNLSKDVRR